MPLSISFLPTFEHVVCNFHVQLHYEHLRRWSRYYSSRTSSYWSMALKIFPNCSCYYLSDIFSSFTLMNLYICQIEFVHLIHVEIYLRLYYCRKMINKFPKNEFIRKFCSVINDKVIINDSVVLSNIFSWKFLLPYSVYHRWNNLLFG